MRLSRRGTLVGVGAVAFGTGSVLSTGAVTSPAPDRLPVERVGSDTAGAVRLLIAGDDGVGTRRSDTDLENQAYVRRNEDGRLTFEFAGASDGTRRTGINENAVTRFDRLFAIYNGSDRPVTIDYESPAGVSLYRGGTPDGDLSDAASIPAGRRRTVGVEIDTTGSDTLSGAGAISIEAATSGSAH